MVQIHCPFSKVHDRKKARPAMWLVPERNVLQRIKCNFTNMTELSYINSLSVTIVDFLVFVGYTVSQLHRILSSYVNREKSRVKISKICAGRLRCLFSRTSWKSIKFSFFSLLLHHQQQRHQKPSVTTNVITKPPTTTNCPTHQHAYDKLGVARGMLMSNWE